MKPQEITVLLELEQRLIEEQKELKEKLAGAPKGSKAEEELFRRLAILKAELDECRPVERYQIRDARITKDLWRERREMQNDILQDLKKRIGPQVKQEAKAAAEAEQELSRIDIQERNYRRERDDLKAVIKTLQGRIQQALTEGADPIELIEEAAFKRHKLEALDQWLESSDGKPAARKALEEAKQVLARALDRQVVGAMHEYQQRIDDQVSAIVELQDSWRQAVQSFHATYGLAPISSRSLYVDANKLG